MQCLTKRIAHLLSKERLGDEKPSEFLWRLKELVGTNKENPILRQIFLSRLPEKWQQVLPAVSDSQSLEKLAQVADKMTDVTSEDVHIASVQTKDSRNNIESLAEVMQCCLKISEKLDTLIDIFKDGYASVSPVRGHNYSTSRNGRRYFAPRDKGSSKEHIEY